MASVRTNLPRHEALLLRLAEGFDLSSDGLGADLLGVVVERIVDRNAAQTDPAGVDWAANRGKYGEAKQAQGLPVGVGLRGEHRGRMVSLVEVAGERDVSPDEATMEYGTSEESRTVAGYFTEGRPGIQEPRPFYEMTEDDRDAVLRKAEEHLSRFVAGL